MTSEEFEAAVEGCAPLLEDLPSERREDLSELIEETRRRFEEVTQSIGRAREALDDWRLVQKYLLFDREASQREAQEQSGWT